MNLSVYRMTLDIRDMDSQLSFSVKQNDTMRRLIISLTDHCKPYSLPEGCYAVFTAKTSKKTVVSEGCQIKDNKIIYDISGLATATVGVSECDISLFGAKGETIATPHITMNVFASVLSEFVEEVVGSPEYDTLVALIGEANTAISQCNSAASGVNNLINDVTEKLNSGEFVGEQGQAGEDGEDGYTPIKGVDYWTEEDKKEITDYVDKEISEFVFVKVVDELPETGLANREYFVRKGNPETNDLFDEYAWINTGTEENPNWDWEFKGTKKLEVEMTAYVKKTERDEFVKCGVTENTLTLTEEEKAAALAWLGVTALIAELKANAEDFTFTLEDGSTVTKKMLVLPAT